jgi:hypothetical protein
VPRPCRCDRCEVGGPYTEGQRFLCWKAHNDPRYAKKWGPDGPTGPTLLEQAVTLGLAVARYESAGRPNVSEEDFALRKAVCSRCEYRTPDGRCGKCGCLLEVKGR